MEDPVAGAILNRYYRRLEQALSLLPAERREQIVEDLRTHVEDALRCEPDRSEMAVLAVLDRLGDPDEVAQEAVTVATDGDAVGTPVGRHASAGTNNANSAPTAQRKAAVRLRVLAPVTVALAAVVMAILTLTGGSSAAAPNRTGTGRSAAPATSGSGWLPSGDVGGGGGVDSFRCSPQTMAGSESTATLEADATQVGSGSIDGHAWSVWSKNGVKGGPGLEEGGVIIDGVAHGLCAGFPNPAEMELLDPTGGGDAIAYGVVGYPGAAKVAIYTSTAGTFDAKKLVGSTTSEVANGVGFFITRLSRSACDLSALELNTASASYATEHNLGFATNHCSAGQLVPINASQGIWQLPAKDFPNHYGSGGGRGGGGGGSTGENIDPVGAAPTEAQLLANFAVLRRPQDSLDRRWHPNCDCGHAARQLGNLTRFVGATGHGSYRIYFDVEQFISPGQDNLPAGSFDLNVDAVQRNGNVSSSSFGPNTQFTVWPFTPYPNLWVSVVPDGVASVTWTFTCSRAQARARFATCSKPGSQTIQAPVINNLAARQVTVLDGCRRMVGPPQFPHCPGPRATSVVWRAADGRVVATFPGFGNLPAPPFVKGSRGRGPLRTLQSTGVGGATIGQDWRSAEIVIAQTLGPAADRDVAVRGCGDEHETVWTSPAVADPLAVFERNDRFAGYTYGAPVNQIGLVQGPGGVLETARGLTIGQTIAHASRLYGHLGTTARHGIGTWTTTGPGTPLSGQVLPTIYPLRRVTRSNLIATIDAGNAGCTNAP